MNTRLRKQIAMKRIQITPLDDFFSADEIQFIKEKFATPHECHKNCIEFGWYYKKINENIRFVAVSLAEANNKPVGGLAHALVKIEEKHFDLMQNHFTTFYVDYEYTLDEITEICENEGQYIIPFVPRRDHITRKWYRYRGLVKEFVDITDIL